MWPSSLVSMPKRAAFTHPPPKFLHEASLALVRHPESIPIYGGGTD